jgi:hypothetical protein
MLTIEQVEFILHELGYETVVEPTESFRYRVQCRATGYREGIAGKCQAALSIMLEAKRRSAPAKSR